MMRLLFLFLTVIFFSCTSKKSNNCKLFLECLDRTVWKITTGTFAQYNVFINDPKGLYMLQYEMYNNSPICREFSFNKKEFKQNKLEMSTKLLGGDARFIWNQNEIYCTYKNGLRTENITFYRSSIKELKKSIGDRTGCNIKIISKT